MNNEVTPVLEMIDITKTFPGVLALDSANLSVRPGEVHGLIGENGAGKSTIIKTLAGIYKPDSGQIRIGDQVLPAVTPAQAHVNGLRFVHQELHLVPTFSVAESVFLGIEVSKAAGLRSRQMRARAEATLKDFLGVEMDGRTLIRDLGPAERKLVQIARALVEEGAKVVVFDEPTAPLASVEVERVLDGVRRLRNRGIGILYVSHYLGEITDICDRVTVFRNGANVALVEDIHDQSAGELISLMVGRDVDQLFPHRPAQSAASSPVIKTVDLSDDRSYQDVNLSIRPGEIIGVAGLLGSGSAELVDTLVGLRRPKRGELLVHGSAQRISSPAAALDKGIVLIPRDRRHDGLVLDLSIADNISLSTLGAVSPGGLVSGRKLRERAQSLIQKLDVRPPLPERATRLLSGGNQQKVVLARALAASAQFMILDEPTVGVDVGAKAEIYRLVAELAAQGTAILVSSNDPTEILGMCDRVLVMVRGRIVLESRSADLTRDELVSVMTGSSELSKETQ